MVKESVIPKSAMIHGGYYLGFCRNATVARWNSTDQRFYYWRIKFGSVFVATVPHKEDDAGFDYFTPKDLIDGECIPFDTNAREDG